ILIPDRSKGARLMFEELMPLLAQRMLILTLSRVSDEEIRVNVIPKPLKSDQRDDDAALTTPLAVTGTPKELDEQLPRQLVEFVEAHLGLSSTLKTAKDCRLAGKRLKNHVKYRIFLTVQKPLWNSKCAGADYEPLSFS
ncbi:MAG: PRTRC system protein E, partial [Candidatus Sulfotelmatobacter sp.]